MGFWEIVVLGVALTADAFAVTLSNSFVYAHERKSRLLLMPVFFGGFQALMPLLGYFAGGLAAAFIEKYAGIVAFLILAVVGGNMVREGIEALRHADEEDAELAREIAAGKHLTISVLFFQAIATAIDAFAVGVGFRALTVDILPTVAIIGLTTALLTCVALVLGRRLGRILGDRAEVVGGIVLILIGLKALLG